MVTHRAPHCQVMAMDGPTIENDPSMFEPHVAARRPTIALFRSPHADTLLILLRYTSRSAREPCSWRVIDGFRAGIAWTEIVIFQDEIISVHKSSG